MSEPLFHSDELRRLDRLRVRPRTPRPTGISGDWRSGRLGSGVLFADYREYAPGDDLRRVDWNVYARLGHLVVKRYEVEQNLDLMLLVDRSLSMHGAKARRARRMAGALGYIALAHLERVQLGWLPALAGLPFSEHSGRGRATALIEELAEVPEEGQTDLRAAVTRVLSATRRRGLAVVISDFYDPAGAVEALSRMRARGLDVLALHIVDDADVEFELGESLRCVDRETGQEVLVDVTREFLDRLVKAWHRRAESLERWCVSREVLYQRSDVDRPLFDEVREMLRRGVALGVR